MFIKEKIVENKLFKDKNSRLTNKDKDDILDKIIDKTELEVAKKPSFRKRANLKIIYALACSLVICVLGFVGYRLSLGGQLVDPNYRGKNVELLELGENDVCVAYSREISIDEVNYINNRFNFSIVYSNKKNKYITVKNEEYYLIVTENDICNSYKINLNISFNELLNLYNDKYSTSFSVENLNSNKSGLLFLILEDGIEFYTRKNNTKYPIFVEFA
ncbi:MAG: hypothetical protein IJV94_01740 [Bacilli bacterium]|nr:hypothetical protein [Bacilli bacterium]